MSTVSDTILKQLGGAARLQAMIGVKQFTGNKDNLVVKWTARSKNGANCVRVTLEPSDTYKVEFLSLRGTKITPKGTTEGLYADDLIRHFERETGLLLSL